MTADRLGRSSIGDGPIEEFSERVKQWRLGERDETLNATLEGTLRVNSPADASRTVDIRLSVDGRAVGKGNRIIDELGSSVRTVVNAVVAKSAGVLLGIKSVLAQELTAYGIDASVDWSLDDLVTEYENNLNEFSASAFKASYGGELLLERSALGAGPEGSYVEVASVSDGFAEWDNSYTAFAEKRDGVISDVTEGLVIDPNVDIFQMDSRTQKGPVRTVLRASKRVPPQLTDFG